MPETINVIEQFAIDPLNIEAINEQCQYCFECGRIEYKDNLTEMGKNCFTGRMLYVCDSCLEKS